MALSGIRYQYLWLIVTFFALFISLALARNPILAFLTKRTSYPFAAEFVLFLINSLALFGLMTIFFAPHPYLCILYILPLIYLAIFTDLKTTFIGSLFLLPFIIASLLLFGQSGAALFHYFFVFDIFIIGISLVFAYPIDHRHQQMRVVEKQARSSSEELASAYEQLKAYTQVLEATSQELEKKSLNLSAINTFNQILNSRLNWSDLNTRILGFVAENFNANHVSLMLKVPEGGLLDVISRTDEECSVTRFQPDKRNWFYLSFFEAAHLVNLSTEELPEYRGDIFWSEEVTENLVAVPLYRGRDVFGALILGNIARELNKEDLDLLQITANQIAIATERSRMYDELERNYLSTLKALANSIEAKDPYTRGHSDRVTHLALMIGEAMDLSDRELSTLHYGGILHDIGKIGVAEGILNKSEALTQDEYMVIQRHPVIGEEIVTTIPFLRRALPLIRHHHERVDGKGYPDGLAGPKIPLPVRILSVCDAFDAMSSDRPYRKALPLDVCLKELADKMGTQFDSEVVQVFLRQVRIDPEAFLAT